MALEYVGGTYGRGTNLDYTVWLDVLTGGIATAPAAGDIVIVVHGVGINADVALGVVTAGYTEEAELWSDDSRDANLSVSRKIMGATPDTSVTVTGSGSTTAGAATAVHVWRGVDQTTPMDVLRTTATGINSSLFDPPAITPVTSGAVVIACGSSGGGTEDTTGATPPTNYGNHVFISSTDPGTVAYSAIASKAWSGSGSEDPGAWSGINTATADAWAAVTLALRPSVGTAHAAGPADTLAVSDATTLSQGFGVLPADTLALADATSFQATFERSVAETLALADEVALGRELAFGETLALADALTVSQGFGRSVDDTLALADALETALGRALEQTVADTLALADTITTETGKGVSPADTLSLTDALTVVVGFTRGIDDPLAMADALTFERALVFAEALPLTDAVAFARAIEIAETLGLVDAVSVVANVTVPDVPGGLVVIDIIQPAISAADQTPTAVSVADRDGASVAVSSVTTADVTIAS